MKRRNKEVFRIGDKVKIWRPCVFIRCGYTLSLQDGMDYILKYDENINDLVSDILGQVRCADTMGEIRHPKLKKEFALLWLYSKQFGGKERKVITEDKLDLQDKEGIIVVKRYVKSGIREAGYFSSQDDYQPNYLSHENTHVICTVAIDTSICGDNDLFNIEDIHLLKI